MEYVAFRLYFSCAIYLRAKHEDRRNGTAMGGGCSDQRSGCARQRPTLPGSAIKDKNGCRFACTKEERRGVEESGCEICSASGRSTRPGAGEQRRVGAPGCGRGERGNTLRAECGQVFCS